MRYIVDVSPEMVDVIQREIEKGDYRSVQEFIINSIQNQIYLIDNPVQTILPQKITHRVETEIIEKTNIEDYLALEKTDITTVEPNPSMLQPTLSGFWNKFLPPKITVRVLSNLQRSNNDPIQLALLQEQASLEARAIGLKLVKTEKKSGRKRGDRLFTGLPVKRSNEKSRSRYKSHFVGNLKKNGIDGMPGTLRLIDIYKEADGKDYVQLTNYGKIFSELSNPILDHKKYDETLSEEERNYLIELIRNHLPDEFDEIVYLVELISQGNSTTKHLIEKISESSSNLSKNQITTSLSGALNRLVDLKLVKRRYDGLSFIYEVTEEGNNIIMEGRS